MERPSDRELEVLALVSRGLSNTEIGRRLFVTEETVKSHVQALLPKLGARNRAHAVWVAAKLGLLDTARDVSSPPARRSSQ